MSWALAIYGRNVVSQWSNSRIKWSPAPIYVFNSARFRGSRRASPCARVAVSVLDPGRFRVSGSTSPCWTASIYHWTVSETLPPCPECVSEYTYEMGALLVCPECAHEWAPAASDEAEAESTEIKDAVGNVLSDGDTVTVIKDVKVKGSATAIKVGTKVRNIRLVNGVGDHDIDCKVDGFGPMQLKSSVVKKV
jgi:protein PhnA